MVSNLQRAIPEKLSQAIKSLSSEKIAQLILGMCLFSGRDLGISKESLNFGCTVLHLLILSETDNHEISADVFNKFHSDYLLKVKSVKKDGKTYERGYSRVEKFFEEFKRRLKINESPMMNLSNKRKPNVQELSADDFSSDTIDAEFNAGMVNMELPNSNFNSMHNFFGKGVSQNQDVSGATAQNGNFGLFPLLSEDKTFNLNFGPDGDLYDHDDLGDFFDMSFNI